MEKKSLKTYGPLFIVLAAFLWGVDGILRRSLFELPPTVIVFFEHLIGAALIAPAAIIALQKEKVTKKEWIALVIIAIFSGVAGTLMFTMALVKVNYISFSVVFLLQKLQPIFAITAAVFLLKERVNWKYSIWAILALVAAYFMTFKNGYVSFATGAGTITAALLAVGAAFTWGSATAFSRFALLRLSSTLTTGLRFIITVPLALLTVYIFKNSAGLLQVTTPEITRLIIIALSTGMVALWIYYRGLKYTEVKVATFLEYVFPLTGVAIDVVYYHNVLATSQYLAALVMLYAIFRLSQMNQAVVYTAKVVKGRGVGKQIGFPTFNLEIPEKFRPSNGIYAAKIWIGDNLYAGAMHFGPIPTYESDQPSLEIFVLDYTDDKKVKEVRFEVIRYLRGIQKFSSPKKLSAQISADVAQIKSLSVDFLN
jgi:drug/metabolite transporter (DMT)-like permease